MADCENSARKHADADDYADADADANADAVTLQSRRPGRASPAPLVDRRAELDYAAVGRLLSRRSSQSADSFSCTVFWR
ncbi:MAG TPA: hypothetical protein VFG86_13810, partial [Chloroflexota bacterium]|nr:hypothetical protein [Chloroflexota bacterium]